MTRTQALCLLLLCSLLFDAKSFAQQYPYQVAHYDENWSKPSPFPDHIILNPTQDPSTSMSVTWRTDMAERTGIAQIAIATAAPKFWKNSESIYAQTKMMNASNVWRANVVSNYHTVTFNGLIPGTTYAYRVGTRKYWSEWFHFRTASDKDEPFSFIYVGDAQNHILDLWARLIREGYRKAPDARFIIYAGDLVNRAHSEQEWHEWFKAGSFIHSMLPAFPTPGNHEMGPRSREDSAAHIRTLSVQWRSQFSLPLNGPPGLEETAYYVDYQNSRIISLNSNEDPQEQVPWLEQVLRENPKKWSIVTFHHPIYSTSERRDNLKVRKFWKPIFDKYRVDLVLQGHDHTYARGRANPYGENIVDGTNARDYTGTVYVVSVSGAKMYRLKPDGWDAYEDVLQDRDAENTQLFQVITIDGEKLSYQSFTAVGELYDAFDLIKSGNGAPNQFIERKDQAIPPRNHDNTIPYYDPLP